MSHRHFLSLLDFSPEELKGLILRAIELKRQVSRQHRPLLGKTLAMIFEQRSTRTRVGFEVGMAQLGGASVFLSPQDTHLGRGEPIADTAKVLSKMVDGVVIRTASYETLQEFSENASVPVINAMTSSNHPCQLLADVQTYWEVRGDVAGAKVAFLGDGYNMCSSYINAARQFNFKLQIACPVGYEPKLPNNADGQIILTNDPAAAVENADLVVTDVWNSLAHEDPAEQAARLKAFADYQVTPAVMAGASKEALFMHCLPAHVGEEVSADMLDHPQSVVWEEAGNRLHSQKALLEMLLA